MDLRPRCQRCRRYVLRADPTRQLRLLDLQAVDTRLDQIAHARATLPQLRELAGLGDRARLLDTEVVNARTALSDVQREVDKAEADVQLVRGRAARDQARLDAGTGTAKDLQALQHEVASLARRQGELEDLELEVMERAEALELDAVRLEKARAELTAQIDELAATRDAALGQLDAEAEQVVGRRSGILPGVGEDLVTLYEKVRRSSGGTGAAELKKRRCGGCGLELNPHEMNRITAAPADEVIRCEECVRILVRTAESGLFGP
ncbi:zinc ribbon domain-containing protein [Lapillicoccus sp.]|uniref:zinc ribbon domain-containing protein n=1 Tax=Lapillicoccus sp. TaxID=1909287 RepID=UPI0039832071